MPDANRVDRLILSVTIQDGGDFQGKVNSNIIRITTSGILDRMMEKNAGVLRIVDRLQKKGLLQMSTCQDEKRLVDVIITEKALQILDEAGMRHGTILS